MSEIIDYIREIVIIGDNSEKYGQLGDYIGGVWGTIISAVALIVVGLTWLTTRRAARLQEITTIFAEMLKTHDAIAESGEFSFWDTRGVPSRLLREFSAIYKATRKVVPNDDDWSIENRIDIAYTFAYYGLNFQAHRSLSGYGIDDLKAVSDIISAKRNRMFQTNGIKMFNGHQAAMSHYFRNLFGMYKIIDNANISRKEKINLSKIIRTKLSNYDQAILALNIVSHLGRDWEAEGLVTKYKPFSNVPEHFFGFDGNFSIKNRFKFVIFEWERGARRPIYKDISVLRLTLRVEILPPGERDSI